VSAIMSGTSLAAASRIRVIPRRTIRGKVNRNRSPLKKLGWNAVLPADVGKQLRQRIVRLQQIGFGLTCNHCGRFSVQLCKEHSTQNPWNGGMVGKSDLLAFWEGTKA
jgi:hypothetical protein